MNRKKTNCALLLFTVALVPSAALGILGPQHTTNGLDTPGEWVTATTNSVAFPFDASTGAGGATLYVDQASSNGVAGGGTLGQTLYLMYDYTHDTTAPTPNSYFDVFFQVPPESTDYLVRMMGDGTFSAFEKPESTSAPTPGGAFDPANAPWSPLDLVDLNQARFRAAIGFGPSHTDSTSHQIAEFELSINSGGSSANGLYDPSPAFWSASSGSTDGAGATVDDPPISSAIFQLNSDGTTVVAPLVGANGDPVLQAALPEPSSALVLGLAGIALTAKRRRRSSAGV